MPKICLEVQEKAYSVRSPLYNYGDSVEWSGYLANAWDYTFQGIVQHRYWDDDPEISKGQWLYWVKINQATRNGETVLFYTGEDTELTEAELKLAPSA